MERTGLKLVFIDAQNQKVRIIDKQEVREYKWTEMQDISDEVSGRKVLYITSLDSVSGDDIVELLSSQTGQQYTKPIRTGRKLLRATRPGTIIAPHHDEEYEPLVFRSPVDFKPYAGEQTLQTYPSLRRYMELGRIELVDEGDVARLRKDYNSHQNKIHAKKTSARDKTLDSILVSEKVDRLVDRIESDGYETGMEAESIDITDDVNRGDFSDQDEEFFRTAKEIGIDSSGVDNE